MSSHLCALFRQPFEHVFPQCSQVIAREDEPSSIVALTLSSPQYVEKLKGIFRGESMDLNSSHDMTAPMSTSGTATPAEESTVTGSSDTLGGKNMAASNASPTEGIYDDIPVFDDSLLSERSSHMKFRKYFQHLVPVWLVFKKVLGRNLYIHCPSAISQQPSPMARRCCTARFFTWSNSMRCVKLPAASTPTSSP